VRDPLSHFVSGFTEAWVLSYKLQIKHAGKPVAPFTVQSFVQFLEQLVTGHQLANGALKNTGFHMYPMSELAHIQPQVEGPAPQHVARCCFPPLMTCQMLLHFYLHSGRTAGDVTPLVQRPHASRWPCTEGLHWL
jgi:hypothetical protein